MLELNGVEGIVTLDLTGFAIPR
jgi:hypothetical protein